LERDVKPPALEQLHDDVEGRVLHLAVADDAHGVRVAKAAHDLHLALEALHELALEGVLHVEDLHGDLGPGLLLDRTIHRSHPTLTYLGHDLVAAVRDPDADVRVLCTHRAPPSSHNGAR